MMGTDKRECVYSIMRCTVFQYIWAVIRMPAVRLAMALFIFLGLAGAGLTSAAQGQADAADGVQQRLFDHAGLLSDQEKADLEKAIAACRKRTGMDVVAVTAFNDKKRSAMEYADDYFDQNGYGIGKKKSGVLFLLYMDGPGESGGECWISTSGTMIRILTDRRIDTILGHMTDYLKHRDYYGAFFRFMEDVEHYVKKGIQAGQYNYDTETGEISVYRSIRWYEAAFALMVPALVAGGACLGVKARYSMKQSDTDRANSLLAYRQDAKFQFGSTQDRLLDKFVTSIIIPRHSQGEAYGRGGSSGRSSTHRSSGGSSHGGGGSRF